MPRDEWDDFLISVNKKSKSKRISSASSALPADISADYESDLEAEFANLNIDKNAVPDRKLDVCSSCGVKYDSNKTCPKCGEMDELVETKFNPMTSIEYGFFDGPVSVKFSGKMQYQHQKSMIQSCTVFENTKEYNVRKEFDNMFYNSKNRLPKNVINNAVELFNSIACKGHTFRGNVRKGIMGACLSYACINKGISKRIVEISRMTGIRIKAITDGIKVFQKLQVRGVIELPVSIYENFMDECLTHYLLILEIPLDYKPFLIDLIGRAEKNNINIRVDCKMSTQCVGAIYMLTTRIVALRRINADEIAIKCCIYKSAFTKYFSIMFKHHKRVKKVFKRYRIPMPRQWSEAYIEPRRRTRRK